MMKKIAFYGKGGIGKLMFLPHSVKWEKKYVR